MSWRKIIEWQRRAKSGLIVPTHCELQRDFCIVHGGGDTGIRPYLTWDRGIVTAESIHWKDFDEAVRAATPGQTVIGPPGNATWTLNGTGPANDQIGRTIPATGIRIWLSNGQDCGNGFSGPRVEGKSTTPQTVGTGAMSFTLLTNGTVGVNSWMYGFANDVGTSNVIVVRLNYGGSDATGVWMKGTVTSWNAGTGVLVVNITSTSSVGLGNAYGAGTANKGAWVFEIQPANASNVTITGGSNGALGIFKVNAHASYFSQLRGIKIRNDGTNGGSNGFVTLGPSAGLYLPLVRDVYFSGGGPGSDALGNGVGGNCLNWSVNNGGVAHHCFLDAGFQWSTASNSNVAGYGWAIKHNNGLPAGNTVWNANSIMGALDVANWPGSTAGGAGVSYVQNFFATGFITELSNFDDNARFDEAFCFMDNCGHASHGADTSNVGNRHTILHDSYWTYDDNGGGAQSANLANGFIFWRGGEGAIYNIAADNPHSQAWGYHGLVRFVIENLRRNSGPYACWATTGGAHGYPAPHQPGAGYVAGTGQVQTGVWIWNISGALTTVSAANSLTAGAQDYNPDGCAGGPSWSAGWITWGTDFMTDASCNNGASTPGGAKPGYTAYGVHPAAAY